jgi:hypothetical protein
VNKKSKPKPKPKPKPKQKKKKRSENNKKKEATESSSIDDDESSNNDQSSNNEDSDLEAQKEQSGSPDRPDCIQFGTHIQVTDDTTNTTIHTLLRTVNKSWRKVAQQHNKINPDDLIQLSASERSPQGMMNIIGDAMCYECFDFLDPPEEDGCHNTTTIECPECRNYAHYDCLKARHKKKNMSDRTFKRKECHDRQFTCVKCQEKNKNKKTKRKTNTNTKNTK